ncbi:unnamed protein product [Nesidiocoris tenuis]|uniref:Uncharacterized protein n=1 Tax=Nesidiocoris tenuis TaxID=355587 RepID=A0A6H5GET8_9HEMI|nr:unnamed protein product [Nesidiocoris tenuis]
MGRCARRRPKVEKELGGRPPHNGPERRACVTCTNPYVSYRVRQHSSGFNYCSSKINQIKKIQKITVGFLNFIELLLGMKTGVSVTQICRKMKIEKKGEKLDGQTRNRNCTSSPVVAVDHFNQQLLQTRTRSSTIVCPQKVLHWNRNEVRFGLDTSRDSFFVTL